MRGPCVLFVIFLAGDVLSMTTPRYRSSTPSLKRDVSTSSSESWSEEVLSPNYEDNEEDNWSIGENSREKREASFQKEANRKSVDRVKEVNKARPYPYNNKVAKVNANRPSSVKSRLCDAGSSDNNAPSEAWSLDSGKVPASLQGGGNNDGLLGLPGGPKGPSGPPLDGGSPWNQVFTAGAVADDQNGGGNAFSNDELNEIPSFGNDDQNGGSSFGNDNQDGFGNDGQDGFGNDGQDAGSFGNDGQDGGSFGNEGQDGASSFGNNDSNGAGAGDNQGGSDTDSSPQCTCMSIIECGATFRNSDLPSEESPCAREGEVCCAVSVTSLPPTTGNGDDSFPATETLTSSLQCGQSRPITGVNSGALTDTNALFAELPWTVLLTSTAAAEDNGIWTYRCAGSLIHPQVVLTAAHCLAKYQVNSLSVRAGDWDLARDFVEPLAAQDRTVQSITIHPEFRPGHPPNDLALLLLTSPFEMADNVNTICLPEGGDELDELKCVATGWGNNPSHEPQDVMKKIVMPIVPRDSCQRALRQTRLGKYFKLHPSFLCAGGEFGKDVCQGDGGGPLTCPLKGSGVMVQVGVTSWGIDCGKLGVPGVFADVQKLHAWVHQELEKLVGPA